ncbi:unnamed protein product [Victoria cruziana]
MSVISDQLARLKNAEGSRYTTGDLISVVIRKKIYIAFPPIENFGSDPVYKGCPTSEFEPIHNEYGTSIEVLDHSKDIE